MGLAYAEGRGVERDPQEALGWMVMAARKGHPRAIEFVRRVQEGARK
jgi:TPR repeat protein